MKKLIKIQPTFNRLVTTMDCYENDQRTLGGVIDPTKSKGALKEYQTVVAVGDTVRSIKVGDVVCINPTRYKVVKHNDNSLKNGIVSDNVTVGYKFNTITLADKGHLMLYDQDIDFVVVESEDVPDQTGPTIIQPDKPKIITEY